MTYFMIFNIIVRSLQMLHEFGKEPQEHKLKGKTQQASPSH